MVRGAFFSARDCFEMYSRPRQLLAGAVFIEYIFGWNGIGKLTVTALENYDLPVVMGIVLFISTVFIVLNILSDVLYGIIDPRIRIS